MNIAFSCFTPLSSKRCGHLSRKRHLSGSADRGRLDSSPCACRGTTDAGSGISNCQQHPGSCWIRVLNRILEAGNTVNSMASTSPLTEEQRQMYATEKLDNFRWISKLVATYSPYTLTDADLAPDSLHQELAEIGKSP